MLGNFFLDSISNLGLGDSNNEESTCNHNT